MPLPPLNNFTMRPRVLSHFDPDGVSADAVQALSYEVWMEQVQAALLSSANRPLLTRMVIASLKRPLDGDLPNAFLQ